VGFYGGPSGGKSANLSFGVCGGRERGVGDGGLEGVSAYSPISYAYGGR